MKLKQALKKLVEMKNAKLEINANIYLVRYVGENFVGIQADKLTVNVSYNGYRTATTEIVAREPEAIMNEVQQAVEKYLQWMREKELKALKQYTWAEKFQGVEEL